MRARAGGREILQLIERFVRAARRPRAARLLELHAAHGILIFQSCRHCPKRSAPTLGGSLENRMRLAVEIAPRRVRKATPKLMLARGCR
ncbi:hypothetical protein ACFSQT_31975 [Mesorhizobium calcicola]|uniref:NADH:flavin oxidoreductase/NADH oxidase N-terminal domain-containing protein n=1 Tax=Mesorhizobium calcicola TaxID=1300310 RepID=A0ABW4WLS0_9HYPH